LRRAVAGFTLTVVYLYLNLPLLAPREATSRASGLLGEPLLLKSGSSLTSLPADALGFFGAPLVENLLHGAVL
jgi:hypothetical protein